MGSGSDSTAEPPFLPLSLRLQGETRTPRQTPARQPRAHWRRARQPEPINGRQAGNRARAHRSPRAGRSEARSRPLGPHVTRQRGRAPHPRTKRRGRPPGCGQEPRRRPRLGAHRDWVAPLVALDTLRPDEGDNVGHSSSVLHLRPGDHRRLDSCYARQNRANRLSCLPCVV